jgi:hypothetical protein
LDEFFWGIKFKGWDYAIKVGNGRDKTHGEGKALWGVQRKKELVVGFMKGDCKYNEYCKYGGSDEYHK